MKTYQTPEILWQDVDLADILTESSPIQLLDKEGSDENLLPWW